MHITYKLEFFNGNAGASLATCNKSLARVFRLDFLSLVASQTYDYIIAGAGAAGLSLAWHLTHSPQLRQKRILLLDRSPKNENDRTWGYWAKAPEPFDSIASWRFQQAAFDSQYYQNVLSLNPYQYQVLEGRIFYETIRHWLRQFPNVHWLQAEIKQLEDAEAGARVKTSAGNFKAQLVFNSCFPRESLQEAMSGSINLKQHFKGWVIETPTASFDPELLRLFDFRTPQLNSLCFFYVIPQSPQRALVEYTLFSGSLLPPEAYDHALQAYITGVLKLSQYQIMDIEWGVIPMSTYAFPQKQGQHIFNIGSLGGASKPSTGYTFRRIQQQCQILVQQLEKGIKSPEIKSQARFQLYDAALLNILDKKGGQGEEVFARLFQKNPVPRLLKFLDEETNPGEELLLMNTVDKPLFLKSLLSLATGLPFR